MSNDVSVYGTCKYIGKLETVESVLKEWEIEDILLAPTEGEFTLDGEYRDGYTGPHGVIEEDYLVDCLRDLAKVVKIESAEFRCYGPNWGTAYDLLYADGDFIIVPLTLQPDPEALGNPVVREFYDLPPP
jgi:hypothetical protein